MELILNINKPFGITSYDVIRNLKRIYPKTKIGHAGTLDPLATGVLICLVGKDATKRQSEFMNVSKEYEFDILFGFETDTYDVLGFPKIVDRTMLEGLKLDDIKKDIESNLEGFKGEIEQRVPPFSAVKIQGKPLYRWYLEGKIDEVEVPVKTIKIDDINIKGYRTLNSVALKDEITVMLEGVRKGFRKEEISETWSKILGSEDLNKQSFLIATIRAKVSKGTYVRAIAHELGKRIGIGGTIIRLVRTRVGDYDIENAKKLTEL